jgi:hypothetical protein
MSMQSIRSRQSVPSRNYRLRGRRGCGSFVTDERNYLPPGRVISSIDHREGGVWIWLGPTGLLRVGLLSTQTEK